MTDIAEAKTRRPKVYKSLEQQLAWFKEEWQAAIPAKLHSVTLVDDGDHLGGPAWTERFRDYVAQGVLWIDDEPIRLEGSVGHLRDELVRMAIDGSLLERRAAIYLFTLACMGFDPVRAGLEMSLPLLPEYAPYYAEGALSRLRQRCDNATRPWQLSGRYRTIDSREKHAVA